MNPLYLTIAGLLFLLFWMGVDFYPLKRPLLAGKMMFFTGEDEDIRIAGASQGNGKDAGADERSATDFFRQHTVGNIQTAIQLGNCLARLFCGRYRQLEQTLPQQFAQQLAVLDSYVVNRVIQNLPNSLIAQTVLSNFYNVVCQDSEVLYQAVRDPVSFSLYLLRDRRTPPTESYGEVFASLCGCPQRQEIVLMADEEYRSFYEQCELLVSGFSFRENV